MLDEPPLTMLEIKRTSIYEIETVSMKRKVFEQKVGSSLEDQKNLDYEIETIR